MDKMKTSGYVLLGQQPIAVCRYFHLFTQSWLGFSLIDCSADYRSVSDLSTQTSKGSIFNFVSSSPWLYDERIARIILEHSYRFTLMLPCNAVLEFHELCFPSHSISKELVFLAQVRIVQMILQYFGKNDEVLYRYLIKHKCRLMSKNVNFGCFILALF